MRDRVFQVEEFAGERLAHHHLVVEPVDRDDAGIIPTLSQGLSLRFLSGDTFSP